MQQFEIRLKNEKTRQYDRMALFFVMLNFGFFIYIAVSADPGPYRIAALGGASLIVIALLIDRFLISVKNNEHTPYRFAAGYITCMTWLQMESWWVALACLVLSTLYMASKRPLLVRILKDHIIYPSIPSKRIAWSALTNVILKDGLLTLNFKNDRFIQQLIDNTVTNVNEQEFNEFCRQQLGS